MEVLNQDMVTLMYKNVHQIHLSDCFDELYEKIVAKKGNILIYTDDSLHGECRSRKRVRCWIRKEIRTVNGRIIWYYRSYPQWLQSDEALNRIKKYYWTKYWRGYCLH